MALLLILASLNYKQQRKKSKDVNLLEGLGVVVFGNVTCCFKGFAIHSGLRLHVADLHALNFPCTDNKQNIPGASDFMCYS